MGLEEGPFESSDEEEAPVSALAARGQVQGSPKRVSRMRKTEYSALMKNLYKDTLTLEHADLLIDAIWENIVQELVVARIKRRILKADPNANVSKLPPVNVQPKDEYIDKREFVGLLSSIDLLQLLTIQL